MTEAEHEAFKAAERASAKPGEWCDLHDDWQVNCGQDADDCWEDEQERRREREDEERCISCLRVGEDCTCDPDAPRCEGCGAPAVTEDDLGVPLCAACLDALPEWPACGAAHCYAPATWADEAGVGWCDAHRDLSLCQVRRAKSTDDFDAEWVIKVGLEKRARS